MKRTRSLLIVLGIASLVIFLIPFGAYKHGWTLFLLSTLIRIGVTILAYQYAYYQGRKAAGWAVGSFLIPSVVPLVLALMKNQKRYSRPLAQPTVSRPVVQPTVSQPVVETPKPRTVISIPTITQEYLSVSLVEGSTLGNAGPGGDAFQQAIQNMNNQNHDGALRSFKEALSAGLDPLRQGYAHANIGNILLLQNRDLAGAVDEFLKVLTLKQALYESVHDAAQYMGVILQAAGRQEEAAGLQRLAGKTTARLGYSLSPDAAEKVRTLVQAASIVPDKLVRSTASNRLIEDEFFHLWETTLMERSAKLLLAGQPIDNEKVAEFATNAAGTMIRKKYDLSTSNMVEIVKGAFDRHK